MNSTIRLIVIAWLSTVCNMAAAADPKLYFPAGDQWETVAPKAIGWDAAGLEAALDFAMQRKSSSVVILYRGRILAERHQTVASPSKRYQRMLIGKTASGRAIEDVASVQKSVTSFLFGIAQDQGHLSLNDVASKHLGRNWSKANAEQEGQIRLKHLLSMSSGLNARLRYEAPVGTKWKYNTTAYAQSLKAIAKSTGKENNDFTSAWLTKPIGMSDSRWIKRQSPLISVVDANTVGFATSARDLARFGLLVQAGGQWNGKQILGDANYLQASTRPTQKLNVSYGYLWWLNGQKFVLRGSRRVSGPLVPAAPKDMFAALGALGRKCYVAPSRGLVVTRLGDSPDGLKSFDREFWRLLMKAAPEPRRQ